MCLAVPGKIVETFEENGLPMGKVDFGGLTKKICLAYVPDSLIGDYVIVHVGFALSKIDPNEALRVFELLKKAEILEEMGAIE